MITTPNGLVLLCSTMSDTEDQLKRMVLAFRVSELQTLLGFAGKNKTGRKTELLTRALTLTKSRKASITKKIKELFQTIQIEVMSYGGRGNQGGGASNPHGLHSNKVPPLPLNTLAYPPTGVSSQQQRSYTAAVANAAGLTMPYSAAAAALSAQQLTASYPINPDVKLKKLPFYDILAELLKPASLVPSGTGRYQESAFSFSLTPQQANKIANSRDLRPGKQDYNVQVQMRFCLLETSCEQEDNFPPNIAVKINDKMCPLPSPIPTNKPGVEPKRPSRPVNITALCRISPTVTNRVQVSWASEYGRCYVISVYLVQKLSSDDLLHRLKSKGVRIADFTRSLIKQKLNEDADCEIATTSLRCSLMCPLGKMRMLLPCRANTCNHLQCFDASLYLQMNERKPTWTCPVCDKPAIYDTLVIDGYFQDVLRLNTTSNEVTLHKDGSWSPLMPKKERPEPAQQEKRKSVVAIETLSDSDDDAPALTGGSGSGVKDLIDDSVVEEVPSGGGAPKKKASDVEIITLETSSEEEDDDDDEEDEESNPPPAKRPYNPAQASSGVTAAGEEQLSTNGGATDLSAAAITLSAPVQEGSVGAPTPVISASVASSLAQLPAATTVLATAGDGGSVAAAVAAVDSPNGSDGAKSDDSWSVGTVDPGKRLVFRKSMSCSSNGTSATTTATANGGSSSGGGANTVTITTSSSCPSSGALSSSSGVMATASPTPSDPLAISPTPPPHATSAAAGSAVDGAGGDTDASLPHSVAVSGGDRSFSGDPHHHSSSGSGRTSSQRPTRTSSRATRFQGITWEGDSDTTTDDDDYEGDSGREDTSAGNNISGSGAAPLSFSTAPLSSSSSSSNIKRGRKRRTATSGSSRSRAASTSSNASTTSTASVTCNSVIDAAAGAVVGALPP